MTIRPKTFALQDYLKRDFECSCGRRHYSRLNHIEIGEGALARLPELVRRLGHRKAFLVADQNTYAAAGRQAEAHLRQAKVEVATHVFHEESLVPDERTMGELLMAFDGSCDLLIAVGSGTLNDIGRSFSYQLGLPFYVVATAPSMDGFASVGAALITNNLKTTYIAHTPEAIVADITVLAAAPMEMITAGVGDILGKYTCLCDWRISHIIKDEYHCPVIEEMVRHSIQQVEESIDQLKSRSPLAVRRLTEALILSGIAMSFVGNSRPASGSEHHLSHFWEMKFLFERRQPVLHGIKVGIGTVAIARLYEMLLDTRVDFDQARRHAEAFSFARWEQKINSTYGAAASGIVTLECRVGKNDGTAHLKRLQVIKRNWATLKPLIAEILPPSQEIAQRLKDMGAPVNPLAVGVDSETVIDSILVAKEVRNRYTLLQLLWDLGLSEEFAVRLAAEFKKKKH